MVAMAAGAGVKRVLVHAFLDGRDTPPKSAAASIRFMDDECAKHSAARIATVIGRYYAMDRDKRWERVRAGLRRWSTGERRSRRRARWRRSTRRYARGESDEFVQPTAVTGPDGRAGAMDDGDVVVFMNFRADRARQITRALHRPRVRRLSARARCRSSPRTCASRVYGDEFARLPVAFGPQSVDNGLGA